MVDPYVKLLRTADKLLALYGKDAEISHTVPGTYDPGTGSTGPDVTTIYTARALEGGYELQHLADTLVEAGNKVGMFKITDAAFTGAVTLQMKIKLQGDHARNLREVQPVEPGPNCLYWKFVSGN